MPPAVSAGGDQDVLQLPRPLPPALTAPVPLPSQPWPHAAHLLLFLRHCGHGVLQWAADPQLLQVSGPGRLWARPAWALLLGWAHMEPSDSVGAIITHP